MQGYWQQVALPFPHPSLAEFSFFTSDCNYKVAQQKGMYGAFVNLQAQSGRKNEDIRTIRDAGTNPLGTSYMATWWKLLVKTFDFVAHIFYWKYVLNV